MRGAHRGLLIRRRTARLGWAGASDHHQAEAEVAMPATGAYDLTACASPGSGPTAPAALLVANSGCLSSASKAPASLRSRYRTDRGWGHRDRQQTGTPRCRSAGPFRVRRAPATADLSARRLRPARTIVEPETSAAPRFGSRSGAATESSSEPPSALSAARGGARQAQVISLFWVPNRRMDGCGAGVCKRRCTAPALSTRCT
jgi:hypothetical protein